MFVVNYIAFIYISLISLGRDMGLIFICTQHGKSGSVRFQTMTIHGHSALPKSDNIQYLSSPRRGGHFEFCNIYSTQEMQNDWTMNIKQNVMSRTRITHDKVHTKKSKMTASRLIS